MDGASVQRAAAAFDAALASHNDAEAILVNAPFLLTRCSSDLRYVFVSEACAKMLGHRADDMIGKEIVDVIGETAFQTILPYVNAVLAGERAEYEADLHYKGAGPRLVHVIYTPDKDRSHTTRSLALIHLIRLRKPLKAVYSLWHSVISRSQNPSLAAWDCARLFFVGRPLRTPRQREWS